MFPAGIRDLYLKKYGFFFIMNEALNPDFSVNEWLSYFEQIHPRKIDLTLDRMRRAAEVLGLVKIPGKIVTVTGTNGKGSVTNLLSRLLTASGYTVNLYNSPHLIRFNERINVHGQLVSDGLLLEAFREVEKARRQACVSLTFFEITTLAAFYAFRKYPADFVVLEVGMGGRFDSTNLLDAELAVITNVALDHVAFLGSDREQIGYQKAGILKSGRTLIYGEPDIPESVEKYAREQNAGLYVIGRDYSYEIHGGGRSFDYRGPGRTVENIAVPTIPVENAVNVLCALELLQIRPDDDVLRREIAGFTMPGRMQKIADNPDVYVDVGHNSHAFAYIRRKLALIDPGHKRRIIAVAGMLKDKDFAVALNLIAPVIDRFYIGSIPGDRGTDAEDLKNALEDPEKRESSRCFSDVTEAYRQASADASSDDLILVFGSFMTAGPVMEFIGDGGR